MIRILIFAHLLFSLSNVLVSSLSANYTKKWTMLNVSLVQYPLEGNLNVDELSAKVRTFMEVAKEKQSDLLVLPELFSLDLLDFSLPETEQFDRIIDEIFPSFIDNLQEMSVQYGIYLLAGSVPARVKGHIRNRSYLFSPQKSSIYQEKIFLTPDEVEWGWSGSDVLQIFDAPWGRTAIIICYDSEIPLISSTLTEHNIDVILTPSMTSESGFTRVRWATQARAIEHMSYVLITGTLGNPAPGWDTTAQAAVLGPSLPGFTPVLGEGIFNVTDVLSVSLDMVKLTQAKRERLYYPAYDQRSSGLEIKTVFWNSLDPNA